MVEAGVTEGAGVMGPGIKVAVGNADPTNQFSMELTAPTSHTPLAKKNGNL